MPGMFISATIILRSTDFTGSGTVVITLGPDHLPTLYTGMGESQVLNGFFFPRAGRALS